MPIKCSNYILFYEFAFLSGSNCTIGKSTVCCSEWGKTTQHSDGQNRMDDTCMKSVRQVELPFSYVLTIHFLRGFNHFCKDKSRVFFCCWFLF